MTQMQICWQNMALVVLFLLRLELMLKGSFKGQSIHVGNIILEEEHSKLKAAVTSRKTILSEKRQVIDQKHLLMTPEILNSLMEAENKIKKRKRTASKKDKKKPQQGREGV